LSEAAVTNALRVTVLAAMVFATTACGHKPPKFVASPSQPGKGVSVGHPENPETWYVLADWLSQQARTLKPAASRTLVLRGLEVNDQALALNPDYYEALKLKAELLRLRAASEKGSSAQKRLIADADAYAKKAAAIARQAGR
jgi:hypothetical protein